MDKSAVIDFYVNYQQAVKQIDAFKTKFKKATNDISNSFLGKIGSLGAAIAGLAGMKKVYDTAASLSNFAEKFNLPIEQVSAFANTLSAFGGNSEEAVQSLHSLEEAMVELRTTGGGALKTVAAQVGLSLYGADGKMLSSMQIIDQLRGRFKSLSKSAQVKVANELGLGSPAALRMLRASDEEYAKIRGEAEKYGVITGEQQKKIVEMQQAIARVKQSFVMAGIALYSTFSPVIDLIVTGMNWLATSSDGTREAILLIAGAFAAILPAMAILSALAKGFALAKAMGIGLAGAIRIVSLAVKANPIGLLISTLLAGAVLVIENWTSVKDFFVNMFDFISSGVDKVVGGFKKVLSAIPFVSDLFGEGKDNKERNGDPGEKPLGINANTTSGAPLRPDKIVPSSSLPMQSRVENNYNKTNRVENNYNKTNSAGNTYNITFTGSYNGAEVERSLQNVLRQNVGGVKC